MGFPFRDITLYAPTPFTVGTPEYYEEISLQHHVSDLYVKNMDGYKPPKTSRITIQPAFYGIWDKTWRNGSIVAIASYFNHDEYSVLDKQGKCKYVLDIIQKSILQLTEQYQWDKDVFEKAYSKTNEGLKNFG